MFRRLNRWTAAGPFRASTPPHLEDHMAALSRRLPPALLAALLLAGVASTNALAGANTFTETIVIDVTGEVVVACTEPVVLSGTLRDVLHVTERADGSVTFTVTTNPAGLSATGLISGSMYRGTGATHQTIISGAPDETTLPEWGAVTFVDRTRLVGTAGEMTLDIWMTFHLTKLDHENVVKFERTKITCS